MYSPTKNKKNWFGIKI